MASHESLILAQEMYVAYYGRPADPEGLAFWAAQFDLSDNLDTALDGFGNSVEFQNGFGGLTDTQLIDNLFTQMFNNPADPEGLAFYLDRLQSGVATLASIAKQIADGAQNQDRMTLDNKVVVANTFTQEVDDQGAVYNASHIAEAQVLLADVDETQASVDQGNSDAIAFVDTLSGNITLDENNPTADFTGNGVGVTVVLDGDDRSTAFDVTGSSHDDTFILEEYFTADIDGGAGFDTVDFSEADGLYTISLGVGTFSADDSGDGLPDFSGTLANIESIIGSDQVDIVDGSDADERIDGGGDIDTLRGGAGNDTFVYEDETDLLTEIVDGETGTDIIEFTADTIDLTGTAPGTVDVETLSLSNLDGSPAVSLSLDSGAGFGPLEFTLITGSSAIDTVTVAGGLANFGATALEGIEILVSAVAALEVLPTTVVDIVTLSGPGAGTITAGAAGTYDLSGTSLSGWDTLAGTVGTAGDVWVLNQTQINALLDDASTALFGAGMADMGDPVGPPIVANDTLQASGSLDLTRITGGLNVYEINFGTANSIEVDDTQFAGAGFKFFQGASGTLIINDPGADGVNLGTNGIGIDGIDVLSLEGAPSIDLTIDENGFTNVGSVVGAATTLTIDTAMVTDLSGSDLSAFDVIDFTGATGGVVLDQTQLDNFEFWGEGGSLVTILTFELAGTSLKLDKVDYDDAFAALAGSEINVTGSDGKDTVTESDGDDMGTLIFDYNLGKGNDTFTGTDKTFATGPVTVDGEKGDDTIVLGDIMGGANTAIGGEGDDKITAADSTDILTGDKLAGDDGEDIFTMAMNQLGVTITDFDGVDGTMTVADDDDFKLNINVGTASSATAFTDIIVGNRLPVLTTNVNTGTMGTTTTGGINQIAANKAIGTKTSALTTLASTGAAIIVLSALDNYMTALVDKDFVLFATNGSSSLVAFVVTAGTAATTSIAPSEIAMVTIADLSSAAAISESDLFLI